MMKKDRKITALQWRKTKIVATLGPASDSEKIITRLIQAGVNVFRLNMSHGDHSSHKKIFERIREVAKYLDAHVAILIDLCGPKIRVGRFVNGAITLKQNTSITISCSKTLGRENIITSQYKNLYKDVGHHERILLDDGNIELRVETVVNKDVICKVIYGGILKDHKGMNLPDSKISVSSFTAKDKKDVSLAMKLGADFVALSFVRTGKDVRTLKNYMRKNGIEIPVISKIEKPEAIENIEAVMKKSYGIMIARGDLGIELPAEKVPLIQQALIDKGRAWNRPVIVATQMMESMIVNARPTRAEVSDVANAALSSADAVMLSAETAIGRYPFKTVKIMDTVLREIEVSQCNKNQFGNNAADSLSERILSVTNPSTRKAVAHAASTLVEELKLQGILIPTRSGTTASILSSVRPLAPLMGLSANTITCRKLALHWGVVPVTVDEIDSRDWKKMVSKINQQCRLAKPGGKVLLVSGFNDNPGESEPVLKIVTV